MRQPADRVGGAPRRLARRRGLTGLRAVAALMVLLFHSLGDTGGATPGGYLGVDVFFVLSGFLITSLLLDELRERGASTSSAFTPGAVCAYCPRCCYSSRS